eukprot:6183764-Pleurochrysis_carterae.AAC.2
MAERIAIRHIDRHSRCFIREVGSTLSTPSTAFYSAPALRASANLPSFARRSISKAARSMQRGAQLKMDTEESGRLLGWRSIGCSQQKIWQREVTHTETDRGGCL